MSKLRGGSVFNLVHTGTGFCSQAGKNFAQFGWHGSTKICKGLPQHRGQFTKQNTVLENDLL